MYLIFDTETTGLPKSYKAPLTDADNWPRMVQLAWQVHAANGALMTQKNYIIKPEGYSIPFKAAQVHGISTEKAQKEGHELNQVLQLFAQDLSSTQAVVGHNVEFDLSIVGAEYLRKGEKNALDGIRSIDTKEQSTDYVKLPGGRGGKYKWPSLSELHQKLFGKAFVDAHDAAYDVDATAKCFFGLLTEGVITPLDHTPKEGIKYEAPDLKASNFKATQAEQTAVRLQKAVQHDIKSPYCHLHVHSQFSVLQATPKTESLISKAKALKMPAVALTDLGNLYGSYHFVEKALKAGIKPVLGCEVFISEERKKTRFTKDQPDRMTQVVLLAKNKRGYHHLAKLCSLGHIEGLYGLYPRVDKALIAQYKEDLICLTGGLKGEIPSLLLNYGEEQAEEALLWWKAQFGDDLYLELNRHGLDEEKHLNDVLIRFAKKHDLKVIAANHVHYIEQKDAKAHEVLLCIKEGNKMSDPVGAGRYNRKALPNDQYYFKSQEEMKALFADLPEAIENTQTLLDTVEEYHLSRDVLLPAFDIPENFKDAEDTEDGGKRGENKYLRHLAYEGAKKRYGKITTNIEDRLDFELKTIENTGYPGYFLIVQDLTHVARQMGVSVGPGRGSAAGSVVAYSIGITNVDPIAYDLLFERFLNPDRVSLPDIDIDFDDEGREKIIQYVIDKYGHTQVAQIITYGTMAAKSSLRDAGRVMELPLNETDTMAKLVPERPGMTLEKAMKEVPDLKKTATGQGLKSEVIQQARIIEGSVRSTGTHACGIIITPDDITQYAPVGVAKDSDLLVTQFDNSAVESAGMLKMDFLGLKTLSIIKTACALIKQRHHVDIRPDELPLDDPKTYELYQRGQTNGTFQFESPGMQKHLQALKPDQFEDLIAMNALYRPGPLQYIPNFIARKRGKEKITYDLEGMEEYLAETYGITVYQEQVMLLSQKLAGFTKGEADQLRKAMGKKIDKLLGELKPKFMQGCAARGHEQKKVQKVWKDWEAFAEYAFNKSHAVCYSVIAYHTAYLKAHYPAEFMAAVLTHNQGDIKQVTFFMEECKEMGLKVLGPDVNESQVMFQVNEAGEIRFGMGAIKGSGTAATAAIIKERDQKGEFKDFFDFMTRINLRTVNKKTLESLAQSGAFDSFKSYHRRQYLMTDDGSNSLIEKAIKYAQRRKQEAESRQTSLFGGNSGVPIPTPSVADVKPFSDMEKLRLEKELVGLYISGHPLERFRFDMEQCCNTAISALNGDLREVQKKGLIKIAGQVAATEQRTTKSGKTFSTLTVEDFSGSYTFFLFSEDHTKFKDFYAPESFLYLECGVQNRWKSQELEVKIKSISLLAALRDKKAQGLKLSLRLQDVSESLMDELKPLLTNHPGKKALSFHVIDPEDSKQILLLSRTQQIDLNDQLLNALQAVDKVKCDLLMP